MAAIRTMIRVSCSASQCQRNRTGIKGVVVEKLFRPCFRFHRPWPRFIELSTGSHATFPRSWMWKKGYEKNWNILLDKHRDFHPFFFLFFFEIEWKRSQSNFSFWKKKRIVSNFKVALHPKFRKETNQYWPIWAQSLSILCKNFGILSSLILYDFIHLIK